MKIQLYLSWKIVAAIRYEEVQPCYDKRFGLILLNNKKSGSYA